MNILCCVVILMVTFDKSVTCFDQFTRHNISLNNTQRTSKFLFDTIFRISSGVSNAFGLETEDDVEYSENNSLSTCDCGKTFAMNSIY